MALSTTTSIAVLPFKNLSHTPDQDFFCDGMTEEIIDALAKIEQLKVISRTSSFYFKHHPASIKEIGQQLDVAVVLEGSVRVRGEALRIRAQLIEVEEDAPFWSQTWDRKMDDLFAVQDEVSLLIADEIREHLGHLDLSHPLVQPQTNDLAAYQHYLKGRFYFKQWNAEAMHQAVAAFEQAVALDPNMIGGQVGLADGYSFLAVAGFAPRAAAWTKATQALRTAQAMDPNHAGLNHMLANEAFFTQADFGTALDFALKALAQVPTHAETQRFVTFLYLLCGQFKKAQDHIFYAKSIDPLNPETLFYEALFYYRTGKEARAAALLDGLLQDNPQNLPALITSLYLKIKQHQPETARAQLAAAPEAWLTPDERLGLSCLIDALDGSESLPQLETLIQHAQDPAAHHAHSYLFLVYARLGQHDKAYALLDFLFQHQSSILLLAFSDPLAEDLFGSSDYPIYHQKLYPTPVAPAPKPRSKGPDPATVQTQLAQLQDFVAAEQPFLNPALTLRLLANQINLPPNQLSWLINASTGKNFNTFINQYRIEHFKKLAVDPTNAHISLIGLAYESGFNSKTVFNTAFKKAEGITPGAYVKGQR